jgi:hypothetical protein
MSFCQRNVRPLPACKWGEPAPIAFKRRKAQRQNDAHSSLASKTRGRRTMPDQQNEQNKPMQGPGENQPITQPDKGNEGIDKDRKASDQDDISDQDDMKKHSPSPNNPNNPNR